MNREMKERIDSSQMILIGLGEEIDACRKIKKIEEYQRIEKGTNQKWILPYVMRALLKKHQHEWQPFYEVLSELIYEKNTFLISTCMDGYAHLFWPERSRIVTPCGQYNELQCQEGCHMDLYEVPEEMDIQIAAYMEGTTDESNLIEPKCPYCGKSLVFNNVYAQNYQENGYSKQWSDYTKWLQGTLNRDLTVLEMGVGMDFPTVIRWPFEKTVFFNQKARMYRIHSRLYQITEEIKDRACGICEDPLEFLKK